MLSYFCILSKLNVSHFNAVQFLLKIFAWQMKSDAVIHNAALLKKLDPYWDCCITNLQINWIYEMDKLQNIAI